MHTYVINLERAVIRRQAIIKQLTANNLTFEIFNAVDGCALSDAEFACNYDAERAHQMCRDMSRGEVGCALSHLGVYQKLIADGRDWALVLEDDANLGADLVSVLQLVDDMLDANNPQVVLLTHVSKFTRRGARPLGTKHKLVQRYGDWWHGYGYVITRAAAQRMLDALYPVWALADAWASFDKSRVVSVYAVVPYCIGISEQNTDSVLQEERLVKMEAKKNQRSLHYYLNHYIYRRFISQIFLRPFLRVAKQKKTW